MLLFCYNKTYYILSIYYSVYMITYLPYMVGIPLTLFFTTYATGKFMTLLGKDRETLNPLATGNPEILTSFKGEPPHVVIVIPSYNDKSIDESLYKWFYQNYIFERQPKYNIIIAEDGEKSYDHFGNKKIEYEYDYFLPNGNRQKVRIEKIELKDVSNKTLDEILIVRRDNRAGFKPGALNNVLYLIETGTLKDLGGIEKSDYFMIVDADHEPGRNRFLRLFLCESEECKEFENKPLDSSTYDKLDEKLRRYEDIGKDLLGLDSYRLNSRIMDDPNSLVTRAVELAEYHRKFVPQLAVVQGYQNHYVIQGSMDELIRASHILAQFNLVLRSPKIKIEVIDKNTGGVKVYEVKENGLLKPISKLLYNKFKKINKFEENGKIYNVYISNHGFPLFTGSSGIIRGDLLLKYKFADGVFTEHQSITEDWELSIRLQRDGYYIFATHQLETWGRPPETLKAYLRQQERWAEGTIRDIKYHFWNIMKNKNLGFTEKFGFMFQGGHYIGALLFILTNTLAPIIFLYITPSILFDIKIYLWNIYYFTANIIPERVHNVDIKEILARMFTTAPVYSKAIIKGLCGKHSSWIVTKRKTKLSI